MLAEPDWIAVEWGTSNLRAWGIGPGGEVMFSATSDRGMGRLAREDYPDALIDLLGGRLAPVGPAINVIICGMAGARQGWLEAPYLDVPADLDSLLGKAVRPPAVGSRLSPAILPGLCQRAEGDEDVMRGEETQLLGLAALKPGFTGVVCMPGTHCKWVRLDGRRVERFATTMTGEMYEILKTHSVLRHSFPAGEDNYADYARGRIDGLQLGMEAPEKLTMHLFKVRSAALLSDKQANWCKGFLSGLLIGADIAGQRDWIEGADVALIGDGPAATVYSLGLQVVGESVEKIDPADTVLAGLKAARAAGA